MSGPAGAYLDGTPDGRLHLQHGPIDLVIGLAYDAAADRQSALRERAYRQAARRFATILDELVRELPLLKAQAYPGCRQPSGAVARKMMAAVLPLSGAHFITPMAAVAGAVADTVLEAMLDGFDKEECPQRIYVNNGGDIALFLQGDADWRVGMARDDGVGLGAFTVRASDPVRGIATSGRGGRSLSMGLADSVTVLAETAAAADAAATIIANAVDLPGHPAVFRAPAHSLVDDSDLGARLVVTGCGDLDAGEIAKALDRGLTKAEQLRADGLIDRAALFLRGGVRIAAKRDDIRPPDFEKFAKPENHGHA
ncbi:UPF0280 family protein [Rhizobium sp. SGZ-381]|uniref:UPF0280 family protein n=1 Tax=Rhizobium sp. SGZ-381 TaxID=3342800 RepID=UPI0036710E6B